MIKRYPNQTKKRKTKIRARLKRLSKRLRLSVFRSAKHIYAQIIDDQKGQTLVSASEKDVKLIKNKLEKAKLVGLALAKKASKKKIKKVYFDRGGFKYHGRIKALAQGAREGGLDF